MLFRKQWPIQNNVVEGKAAAVIGTGVTGQHCDDGGCSVSH